MLQQLRNLLWSPEQVITVQQFFGDGWEWLFEGLTLLGASPGVALILAISFWLKGRQFAVRLGGILLLTVSTNALLWNTVQVPRPDDPGIVQRATVSVTSFPSGHTASATAIWGSLVVLRHVPLLVAVAAVAAVMLSRLYLGVHYLGDLVGGLAVGLAALAIYTRWHPALLGWLAKGTEALARRLGRHGFLAALAVGIGAAAATLVVLGPTQKGWEIGGAVLGAGLALPLETHYVNYRPARSSRWHHGLKLAIGLAGLGVLALGQLVVGETPAVGVLFALAPLWMILIAPWIFSQLEPSPERIHMRADG